jgi:diguanylate cyclase (GGDEF)-like protein
VSGGAATIAGFEVIDELGRGARTIAYRVRRDAQVYALRVADGGAERAVRREAALLAGVDHPGVARVHEVGSVDGRPYIVMDLVEGRPLTTELARGPLPIESILSLGIDVAEILAAAHRSGLVHRDVKPDNLLVTPDGSTRLVDFSLAARSGDPDSTAVIGTLRYSAPEQSGLLRRPVDGRADLYALGAVLYECATGAPPFDTAEVGELLRRHAHEPAPDPRDARPELPAGLATIISRLLAKDPDDRFPSGDELAAALRAVPGDRRDGAHPRPATRVRRLVGRDQELAALTARWARARTGAGGAALITGAAGLGKSHLAGEIAAAVAGSGGLVLAGKADRDGAVPLAALRHAVDTHLQELAASSGPEADRARSHVRAAAAGPATRLLGDLSRELARFLGLPARSAGSDDEREQPFAPAAAGFLARLARHAGGLLLYLDDVQWLDDATRRVLVQLAAELPSTPMLVLATARDDTESTAAVAALRAGLGAALDLAVPLAPLPAPAVGDLVALVSGGLRLDAADAARLAARSDGNPLALREYVAAVVDSGLLVPHWGTWHLDVDGLADLDLPTDAMALILTRLAGLGTADRRVLVVSAELGAEPDPAVVAAVCGVEREQVLEALAAGVWGHLVERRGGRFGFVHDRIRDVLASQLDEHDRRDVHERAAEALDRMRSTGPLPGARPGRVGDRELVYALAGHCLLGDPDRQPERTYRACTEAGRVALADQAPDEALRFLLGAADAADRAGIVPDAAFLELLGTAQHRAGRFDDAVTTLHRAVDATGDRVGRARLLGMVAMAHDAQWATAEQAAAVERALVELGRPVPRNPVILAASTAGLFAAGCAVGVTGIGRGTVRGDRRERYRLLAGLSHAGQLAYARELQPRKALVFALRDAYVVNRLGRGPEAARSDIGSAHLALVVKLKRVARRAEARARAEAAATGDPRVGAYVEWLSALDRYFFGFDQGESVQRAYTEQRRWLDAGQASDLLLVLLWDALMRGDMAAAEGFWAERDALIATSVQTGRITTHATEAVLLALRGRLPEAVMHLERMRARPSGGERKDGPSGGELLLWERVDILWATMAVAVEHDDLGDRFDDAVAELDGLGLAPLDLVPVQRGLYLYRALGRVEQARAAGGTDERVDVARQAVAALGRAAATPMLRAYHRLARASLLEASGRPDSAVRELGRSAPVLDAVDAPLIALEVARIRARALRTLGNEGEAIRQSAHALAIATEQGWPHRVRRLTVELDLARSTSRAGFSRGSRSRDGVASGVVRERLDAIEQVGLAVARERDPARVAALALDETIRILRAERAFLFLAGDDGALVPSGGRDATGADLHELTGYGSSLVERVRTTREALVVTGTDEGEALGAESVVLHGLRSIMVAPLLVEGRLLGVVYLDSRVAKGIFTADDVGVLTAITNHIAVSLESARAAQLERAVTAADERRRVAETLRDGLAAVTASLAPASVLESLAATLRDATGGERLWLVLDAGGGAVQVIDDRADRPEPGVATPVDRCEVAELLTAPRPVVVGGSGVPAFVRDGVGPSGSVLVVPLAVRERCLGVVLVGSRSPGSFGEDAAGLAAALAAQGMVAYENAQLFTRVQELAAVDELTGLANRRHFFEQAERELAHARRFGHPVSAMMIDVDHFKAVNDRWGHQVGDEILREIAARLRRARRVEDVVGRYGGEEFVVLAPGDGEGLLLAERLRSAVSSMPMTTSVGQVRVTISIGVAVLTEDLDLNALLARADRELYEAKRAGRNRVHRCAAATD